MSQPITMPAAVGVQPEPAAVATEPKAFTLSLEKFTKQNVFDLLDGIADGKSPIQFLDAANAKLFKDVVKRNFEPQSGGGKSNNPSHIDPATGLMVHWCRFLKKYMPEVDMVMSGGKSKGASKLASKHNYELGKQAQALKDEALLLFANQQYAEGAAKNAEATTIEESRNKAETYSDAVLAQYLPKAEEPKTIADAIAPVEVAPVAQPVVEAPGVAVAVPNTQGPVVIGGEHIAPAQTPVGTYLGNDANGNPVYQA